MSPGTSAQAPLSVRIAVWLMTLQSVPSIFGSIYHVFWEHGRQADWTPHQRSHAIWAGGQGVALPVLMVLLAWMPFRRGERWSWYALLIATLGQYGALVVGYGMTGWYSHLRTAPEVSLLFVMVLLAGLAAAAPFFWRSPRCPGS